MECSIIICTRNRASRLAETLGSFANVRIPDGWRVEMIVADNGSSDDTAAIVRNIIIPGIHLRYVFVAEPGKSRAQNAAIAMARGTALLFTDDDVEPAEDWLDLMARPLLQGTCDAVGGRISLAGELRRPWMDFQHLLWLADVPSPASNDFGLVGANMGIHRSVFVKTGLFDVNLGPGASGFGEETLLWRQMLEAGMRIMPVTAAHVVHRPDASRLQRAGWLAAARDFGRTRAYLMHHWEYAELSFPRAIRWWNLIKLHLRNPLRFLSSPDDEGCPSWEMSYLVNISCCEMYLQESVKPRNYPVSAKSDNELAISGRAGQSLI
jgi:glycosyltransferase involved in cell wall biosynthesis